MSRSIHKMAGSGLMRSAHALESQQRILYQESSELVVNYFRGQPSKGSSGPYVVSTMCLN